MIFILSSICRRLEFWSVNHTSVYENSEPNVFPKYKIFRWNTNNCPNNLLRTNAYKTVELCWQLLSTILQCTNITSVISRLGTFIPFSVLIDLLLVLQVISLFQALKAWDNVLI